MLLLAVFCGFGLRRFAAERDPWLLALASLGLAHLLVILAGALLLPWMSPRAALVTLGLLAALVIAWARRTPFTEPLRQREDSWWLTFAAMPGLLLTGYFALFIMSTSLGVDDGFFLHISNMGLIIAGRYPPVSFLGETLQGHYGKDLLTALMSVVYGTDFLQMEWISTTFVQLLHFLFLIHWFRVEGGRPAHGLLGAYFLFFVSAMGSHLGLVDTVDNNNAVAYFAVSLCSYLLLRWRRTGLHGAAVLAGIFLGLDALIYETHFGLLGLTLFTVTLPKRRLYKGFVLLVSIACLLASVEGGAVTQIAKKTFFGRAKYQRNADKAWQSQNVELKFPKEKPFYLRRDNLRPSRFFETRLRPESVSFVASREAVPLWSGSLLNCFWYPVWLAPLVLLGLLRQRNLPAAWFFLFGVYAILTPSLVSFGYFEGETTRWFFAAAIGFSTAYALVLAESLGAKGGWRYLAYAVLVWTLAFNYPVIPLEIGEMRHVLANPGITQPDGSPGVPPKGGLIPSPRLNMAYHHGFTADDWTLVERLKAAAKNGSDFFTARFLSVYRDERVAQGVEIAAGGLVNVVGLRTGLSGRLPTGLAGAPDNKWSPPLFSPTLEGRAFWADPQGWRLRKLQARWLFADASRLQPGTLDALKAIPGMVELERIGTKSLWQYKPQSPDAPVTTVGISAFEPLRQPLPAVRPRHPFTVACQLRALSEGTTELEFRYRVEPEHEIANPDDLLLDRIKVQAGDNEVLLHLVGPFYPGRFKLDWRESGSQEWQTLTEVVAEEPN